MNLFVMQSHGKDFGGGVGEKIIFPLQNDSSFPHSSPLLSGMELCTWEMLPATGRGGKSCCCRHHRSAGAFGEAARPLRLVGCVHSCLFCGAERKILASPSSAVWAGGWVTPAVAKAQKWGSIPNPTCTLNFFAPRATAPMAPTMLCPCLL